MSSLEYRPASAPWLNQLSETARQAGVERIEICESARSVRAPRERRGHLPGGHHAVGIAFPLVQARACRPGQTVFPPEGCGESLPSLAKRRDPLRFADTVNAVIRHERREAIAR